MRERGEISLEYRRPGTSTATRHEAPRCVRPAGRPLTRRSLMRLFPRPTVPDRRTGRLRLLLGLSAAVAASGCGKGEPTHYASVTRPPTVRLTRPVARDIVRTVGQPSFIEAYERTSIYPKVTGYIEKWIVDIGDKVKKDQVLATLFVPELVEDYGTKK